jgi:hypothetical protein
MDSELAKFIASQPETQKNLEYAEQGGEFSLVGWSNTGMTNDFPVPAPTEVVLQAKKKSNDVKLLKSRDSLVGVEAIPLPSTIIDSQASSSSNSNKNSVSGYRRNKPKLVARKEYADSFHNHVTFDDFREYFHLPMNIAVKESGVSLLQFRKAAIANSIDIWPHKLFQSLNKTIKQLEMHIKMLSKPSVKIIEKNKIFIDSIKNSIDEIFLNCKKKNNNNDNDNDYAKKKRRNLAVKAQALNFAIKNLEEAGVKKGKAKDILEGLATAENSNSNSNSISSISSISISTGTNRNGIYFGSSDKSERKNQKIKEKSRLKKGWLDDATGSAQAQRLPVRDELLDTLGCKVDLKILETCDIDDDIFTNYSKNDDDDDEDDVKSGDRVCHDGPVVLPKLNFMNTTEINKDGLTIILIEPKIFHNNNVKDSGVEFVPSFCFKG